MNRAKKESFFWTSYADLMTSLFFVMLVLFVLVIVLLHSRISEQDVKLEEFRKIEEIKKSINEIDSAYFTYNSKLKKHIFNVPVEYSRGHYEMRSIKHFDSLEPAIIAAGKKIQNMIQKFTTAENIQYLVIIEGQASKDSYYADDYYNNNVLSYLRALKLKEFWESKGIRLGRIANCEIIVAGSGEEGVPRDRKNEKNNQRFLIHIIPKTGEIK
jgi:hypothetical protein